MTPDTIETLVTIDDDDLPCMVRAWFSHGYSGWMWTAIAEGHDEVVSGKRAWVSARGATEMAVAALTRRYA